MRIKLIRMTIATAIAGIVLVVMNAGFLDILLSVMGALCGIGALLGLMTLLIYAFLDTLEIPRERNNGRS